jgi:hypothetical protein
MRKKERILQTGGRCQGCDRVEGGTEMAGCSPQKAEMLLNRWSEEHL